MAAKRPPRPKKTRASAPPGGKRAARRVVKKGPANAGESVWPGAELCQSIFDRVTEDVVWQLDLGTGRVCWSSGRKQLFGYRAKDMGRDLAWWRERAHPDDLDRLRTVARAGLRGRKLWTVEWRLRCRDGSFAEVMTRALRLPGPPGGPVRLVGLLRDLSAERLAQRRAEERFRILIEESGEGAGMIADDGTFLYNSPPCLRIFGYSDEELRGRSAFDFVHPDEADRVQKRIAEYLAVPGQTLHLRQRFRHKDGSWRWIESTSRNLLAEPGIGATVTNYRDVTEQVRSEEALRESEEKWRSLVENAPGFVIILDAHGRIEFINRILPGLASQNLVGRIVYDLVDSAVRGEMKRLLESVLRTGIPASMEAPASGTFVGLAWFRVHVGPLLRNGRTTGLIVLATDISEERRLRDDAQRAHERVEQQAAELARTVDSLNRHVARERSIQTQLRSSRESLRALSARLLSLQEDERRRLSREVHDELGQSLTAIKMEVEALRRAGGADSDGQRPAIDRINGVIASTIETIRRMARGLRPGALDDLGLVAAVEGLVRDFEERSGVACRLQVPAEELDLDSDRAIAVFRVVQEALTNVARHAGASRVSVRLSAGNGALRLTVRDNGRGITLGETDNRGSLGLIGIRERVRLCGGRVGLKGSPGTGTVLRVQIPLVGEVPEAEPNSLKRADA